MHTSISSRGRRLRVPACIIMLTGVSSRPSGWACCRRCTIRVRRPAATTWCNGWQTSCMPPRVSAVRGHVAAVTRGIVSVKLRECTLSLSVNKRFVWQYLSSTIHLAAGWKRRNVMRAHGPRSTACILVAASTCESAPCQQPTTDISTLSAPTPRDPGGREKQPVSTENCLQLHIYQE